MGVIRWGDQVAEQSSFVIEQRPKWHVSTFDINDLWSPLLFGATFTLLLTLNVGIAQFKAYNYTNSSGV